MTESPRADGPPKFTFRAGRDAAERAEARGAGNGASRVVPRGSSPSSLLDAGMSMEDAASLERQGREQLERATTAAELEDARVATLGRSSALTLALRELGELPAELRGARGQDLNRVRAALEELHGRAARRGSSRSSSTPPCAPTPSTSRCRATRCRAAWRTS